MIKHGNISYFTINESGLYSYGINSKKIASNSEEILATLFDWLKDRPFPDTSPWVEPNEVSNRGIIYCQDKYYSKAESAYAFVLWKSESNNKEKNFYGISSDDHKDVVLFDGKHNGKDVIWGRPCYYVVLPAEEKIVSVKFDDSLCDKELFCDWVSRVVSSRAKNFSYRSIDKNEDGSETIKLKSEEKLCHLKFNAKLLYNPSTYEAFKKMAVNVRGLIYQEHIKLSPGADDKPRWLQLFNKIVPYIGAREKDTSRKICIEIEVSPTAEEMQAAFENHLKDVGSEEKPTRDLGFLRSGNMPTIWANDYRVKSQVSIESKSRILTSQKLLESVIDQVKENIAFGINSNVPDVIQKQAEKDCHALKMQTM